MSNVVRFPARVRPAPEGAFFPGLALAILLCLPLWAAILWWLI